MLSRATGELLCREYGLGDLSGWHPLQGTRNQNYVLDTASGRWFIRLRFAGYSEPARIDFDHAAVAHLARRGVAVVPPRPTASGDLLLRHGGRVWEAYPFVPGRQLREADAPDARALGRALGAFHRAGESFAPRLDKLGPRGEADPAALLGRADRLEAQTPDVGPPLRRYREWLTAAGADLPDERFAALPHTLVHGDVQPANVLLQGDRVAAFVDLDWCGWRPRVYDLAAATLVCCAAHAAPIEGGDIWSLSQGPAIDPAVAAELLTTYQGTTTPLSDVELRALRAQIVLTWCHIRIDGASKVPAPERAAFLARPPTTLPELLPHLAWP